MALTLFPCQVCSVIAMHVSAWYTVVISTAINIGQTQTGFQHQPVCHVLNVQAAFFWTYAWTLCVWLLSEYLHRIRPARAPVSHEGDVEHQEGAKGKTSGAGAGPEARVVVNMSDAPLSVLHPLLQGDGPPVAAPGGADHKGGAARQGTAVAASPPRPALWSDIMQCDLVKCACLNLDAIHRNRDVLRAMAEFGTLMAWYFLCDRTTVIPASTKSYSRDVFLFVFLILVSVAFGTSLQTLKSAVLLNRQQTEEWKGWMQVLFLLYHYFEAREYYNAIRIFIAGYVWMTGFGNYCYYVKTADFSVGRFAQMMWRLNFLVLFACVALGNSYMLYYICPMHTIFTVMVYGSLAIMPHLNTSKAWLLVKMALNLGAILLLWDCKAVFYAIWQPLTWLVGYVDPRKPADQDPLYEWYFRSSLDRFVWIYGMLCGMLHPYAASALSAIDAMPLLRRVTIRTVMLALCAAWGYWWLTRIYFLDKLAYNAVHPYTSWMPITLWIVVRNLTPSLRLHHLRLFGWLGCITLETYICQFHIWMRTDLPDGQPKALLAPLPSYPLINFALVSFAYVYVSHRIFELTNTLKNSAVPHSNNHLLLRNLIVMLLAGALIYLVTLGCYQVLLPPGFTGGVEVQTRL